MVPSKYTSKRQEASGQYLTKLPAARTTPQVLVRKRALADKSNQFQQQIPQTLNKSEISRCMVQMSVHPMQGGRRKVRWTSDRG